MRVLLLLILLMTGFVSLGQVNLNQGLIAFYPFSNNANDVSGNNINGIVNNAVLTTDRFGIANSAYYFNGSNSYIQLPYSSLYDFAPQDSFSISVRILPDQGYAWPAQGIVVKSPFHASYTLSLWNYGIYVLNYKAMGGFAYNNIVNGTTTFTGAPCWYNVVMTYKNGIWKLYVDGVLESTDLTQTKFILQDGPASKINFGKKGDSNGDYYKGKMDDVRIYNRVLRAEEAIALIDCSNTGSCNNWLSTQSLGQNVSVGDLDISGNQITVEASFNKTIPGGPLGGGFLVSKHTTPGDINYALWPNGCAISTANGDVLLEGNCPVQQNQTYHVAMVYDGTSVKFYRNGFLHKQAPASGNLILNNWLATIGQSSTGGGPIYPFTGYINEVRLWNVARTQAELQAYMNISLPNPTTQPGLQGYYIFDDLVNRQGNATFNVVLHGGAAINTTNPNCTLASEVVAIADAGPDTSFCSNSSISHVLQGSGIGTTYSWTPAIYLDNPGVPNPRATISATTKFYLTVSNPGSPCAAVDSVTIHVNPLPTVKTIGDTLICSTNTVTLLTNGAQTYSWTPSIFLSDPNVQNPIYSGNQSQAYYVTGTDANGCKAEDTVSVTVNVRGTLKAPPDKSICGQSSVLLDGFNGNTVSYLWSPGTYLSSTTIINPIATPPSSTPYNVKISDLACAYDSNFTVQVIVGSGLAIGISKSNDIDCANRSATLHASGGDTYLWTPSTGLNDPTSPDPVASPVNTQQYVVLVTNASGCSSTDSITVILTRSKSLARFMPNAFTPNGDGKNDCYGLKDWAYIKKLKFIIFNRYGEQVFGTSNPNTCWDGTYKGKHALAGTYVFYILAETECGTEEQKGNFILLR